MKRFHVKSPFCEVDGIIHHLQTPVKIKVDKMDIKLDLDAKKVQKALGASEKQMERIHRRAANRTAVNVRAIASKGSLGLDGLRRKKVPRAQGLSH